VLVVCLDDNAASIKTIERHGGVLHRTVDDGHGVVRHYWIDL
jgi:predicted acetyltransferase